MIRTLRLVVTILFGLSQLTLSAQTPRNLVFEGAGIRGLAYAGAIQALEERNIMQQVEKVGGTSAGAIAALTISLGYNSKEIEAIIYNTKLQKFNDGKFFFIGGISRMNRNYGWYRGKAFTSWLENIIEAKTGNADITFRQLHDKKFKDLYVTGTRVNNQKLIVFSYETYPNMKIKDAVRISMSIPLYFEAVFIDSTGNVLNKKKAVRNYDIMVDGGFTGNFPIFIFDSTAMIDDLPTRFANSTTIGLRIDTPEQMLYDANHQGLAPIPIHRFKSFVGAFYNYVIENLNRTTLSSSDWKRTVSISSGNIGPKIRKLSPEEKNMLIKNGYSAMQKFLTNNP
jgi:NTE family protein